ncbi:uncharacterized protein [Erythrolamprus reginae]|uniref:uncharacterized protein n=1 Tax=Erythrolamprus reginae TaxID=121349 RepID=UPI00396CA12D
MKMLALCAGILLHVLHATDSWGNEVKTTEVPLGGTVNISCEISSELVLASLVTWYKEGQNKNLCKIDQDNKNMLGSEKRCTPQFCNLIINNAQRNDSGTYICIVSEKHRILPMQRTRVIITETLKPNLSILVPSFLQDGPLKHDIPLLCTVFNVNPNSNTLIWNISGKISQDKMDVDMIDGKGAFSIWNLKLVSPEDWNPEMSYDCLYTGNMLQSSQQ